MSLLEEISAAGFYVTQEFITMFDVVSLDHFKYILFVNDYIESYEDVFKKNKNKLLLSFMKQI